MFEWWNQTCRREQEKAGSTGDEPGTKLMENQTLQKSEETR